MFKAALALMTGLFLFQPAHALKYGTAVEGEGIPPSPVTFSIYSGGKGETGSQIDWVAQAIELPYGLHEITLNSISFAILPGTKPYLLILGGQYSEATYIGEDWVKFDLAGATISTNRFVLNIFGETYRCCDGAPDSRLANMPTPSGFEGSHLITEAYGEFGVTYTHTVSDHTLAFSLDYNASVTPVPEAGRLALLVLGLVGVSPFVRRGTQQSIHR